MLTFRGTAADFQVDLTRYIDLEGAFRSGKTTAALRKVLATALRHPGMRWLICRYGDGETQTKLKGGPTGWRAMCQRYGVFVRWDATELCDTLPNGPDRAHAYEGGSKVYIFGLKTSDSTIRYAKIRGLTLAGIYVDQAEELPYDLYLELAGVRMSQEGYPHQLIITPNPPDETHWISREFPEDNSIAGHHYYAVSIFDNADNLPTDTVQSIQETYPPGHAKHRPAVLGRRGLSIIGDPVYGKSRANPEAPFDRARHVRPLTYNPAFPLYEALDFGKHHPCWIAGQFTYGGLAILGGILGQDLFLEDFLPIVLQHRQQWFPGVPEVLTCCDPAGAHESSQGLRQNVLTVLRDHGLAPMYNETANTLDVRAAMIERLAGYMRRRTTQGEAFGIANAANRWLRISGHETHPWPFLADACEAGYVWDKNPGSVGHKQVRKPKKDGWYEHGMNCLEYLELHFGGLPPRPHVRKPSRRDRDPFDLNSFTLQPMMGQPRRGGY